MKEFGNIYLIAAISVIGRSHVLGASLLSCEVYGGCIC